MQLRVTPVQMVRLLQRPKFLGSLFQDGQRATLVDCLRTQDRHVLAASGRQNVPDHIGSDTLTHTICMRTDNIATNLDVERIVCEVAGRLSSTLSTSRTAQFGIS